MGLPVRASRLANIHDAFASRRRATKKSDWADSNPEANDIFTKVIKLRKELAKRGDGES